MPKHDVDAFNIHYDTWCADRLPGLPGIVKPFEFFCADQFLKARLLSDKEVLSGQVDAKDDGGVDSFYCFLNNVLVDDTTKIDPRSGGAVELKVFQCKQGEGFSPTAINKFSFFMDDLLTLSRKPSEYHYAYHDKLIQLMATFKLKFQELKKRSVPKLSIEFFYITRRDVWPNRNAKKAADKLVEKVSNEYYSETTVEPFNFVSVSGLWTQFKIAAPELKTLPLVKSFDVKEGWVGLVTLREYFEFLKGESSDGKPQIDEHIFDSNVRGYALSARVNTRITRTLTEPDKKATDKKPDDKPTPEFWLLNNGITILSPDVTYADERLSIENPQIVNGLQTSRRIFEYCRDRNEPLSDKDTRRILVRVIKSKDEITRSNIIRATNDQNPMPAEAFLSTLRLQHQIETYFEKAGYFYDRRKGHYKSLRKPAAQIVGIVDLMQAVLAIMLRQPNTARGRPRDYLKDGKRQQLFGADDPSEADTHKPFDFEVYLRCVQIVRKVDDYLALLNLDDKTTLNIRFYVALDLASTCAKNAHCPPGKIQAIDVERDFSEALMQSSYKRIRALYNRHGKDDDAAKGKKMAAGLVSSLKLRHSPSNKSRKAK
jgi:hypothetical protein